MKPLPVLLHADKAVTPSKTWLYLPVEPQRQHLPLSCGAACLVALYGFYGVPQSMEVVWQRLPRDPLGTLFRDLVADVEKQGFSANSGDIDPLHHMLPIMIYQKLAGGHPIVALFRHTRRGEAGHYGIIHGYCLETSRVAVMDPEVGESQTWSLDELRENWKANSATGLGGLWLSIQTPGGTP